MKVSSLIFAFTSLITLLNSCKRDEEFTLPKPLDNEVILYTPTPNEFLNQSEYTFFDWSFDRGDLVGPIKYNLIITEFLKSGDKRTHIKKNISKSEYHFKSDVFTSSSSMFKWRVEMIRENSVSKSLVSSDEWDFEKANFYLPQLISPANNAIGVMNNNDTIIKWELASWTDPDLSYPIHYNFYFSTDSNPTLFQALPSDEIHPENILTVPNTTYYWRVEARNNATILGSTPIWSFTTGSLISVDKELEMVFVPSGTFSMGCPSSTNTCENNVKPAHNVTLDNFYISKYEVTNTTFCDFLNEIGNQTSEGELWYNIDNDEGHIVNINGHYKPAIGKENHPVANVTWHGANAYANWIGGRLPTEAEWEYAASGGITDNNAYYSGSKYPNSVAWYSGNQGSGYEAVGLKSANELGIYDMSGNVQEWCSDWYNESYYNISPSNNPEGPNHGSFKITRGGHMESSSTNLKVYKRKYLRPYKGNINTGIRVVIPE